MTTSFTDHELLATNLQATRGLRCLFTGLNINLRSGEALRVTGANGVGKTTLMRILVGLGFNAEGQVLWNGLDIRQGRDDFHQQLHYLGHLNGIKAALTVEENLRFTQRLAGRDIEESLIELALETLELSMQKLLPCHALSAGQKQRVALARLMVVQKPLWVLDEAFTALDAAACQRFEQLMIDHLSINGMIIFTSHQQHLNSSLDYQQLDLNQVAPA